MVFDKVICPWCGADMSACYSRGKVLGEWKDYYDAHLRCTGCGAQGPFARWNTPEGAKEAARAAALRRYTPPIKPMTLEEVKEVKAVWIEDPEQEYESKLYPAIYWGVGNGSCSVFVADIDDGEERAWYPNEEYGTWWRCWERKPTEAERSAAEWEE